MIKKIDSFSPQLSKRVSPEEIKKRDQAFGRRYLSMQSKLTESYRNKPTAVESPVNTTKAIIGAGIFAVLATVGLTQLHDKPVNSPDSPSLFTNVKLTIPNTTRPEFGDCLEGEVIKRGMGTFTIVNHFAKETDNKTQEDYTEATNQLTAALIAANQGKNDMTHPGQIVSICKFLLDNGETIIKAQVTNPALQSL